MPSAEAIPSMSSQRRLRNARHPSRRSLKNLVPGRGASRIMGRREMKKALMPNVTASTAKAHLVPMVTMIRLASTGPAIVQAFCVSEMRALACCRRPAETVCGTIPVEVGRKKALPNP